MVERLCAIFNWVIDPVNLTAFSTGVIAVFTVVLAVVGFVQARLIRKSINLARQEFIATHRPKVIVRFIQGPSFDDDAREIIFVTVANVGINLAIIREFGCDLGRRMENHWLTGINATPKPIEPIRLISGEQHTFTVRSSAAYSDAEIADDAWAEICALGKVRYADESDIVRETGFFRIFDRKREAFAPSQDESEEYQD